MNNYNEVQKNYMLWYLDLKDKQKFEKKRKEFLNHHIKSGVARVQIEPTQRCNYRCQMCPIDELKDEKVKYDLTLKEYKNIVDALPNSVTNICLSGLGEPFINEDYVKMVKYTKEKGYYVEVYNNGSLFDKDILPYIGEVNFSVDGADEEMLKEIRKGVQVDKLFDNIRLAVKLRKSYKVNINFTANQTNYKDIKRLYKICQELEIDALYIQGTSNNYATNSAMYRSFSKYIKNNTQIDWNFITNSYDRSFDFSLLIWYPRKMKGFCPWTFSNVYINKNSEVISCCQKVTEPTIFGNLKDKGFNEIYNSKAMNNFRQNHIKNANIDICNNCPN
jgi:pyrroloquinoline quinone biosynthesis protein E